MLQKRRIIAAGGDLRTVTAAARLGRQAEVLLAGFERLTALPLGVTAADAGTVPEQSADVLLLPVQRTDDRYDAPFSRAPVLLSAMLPAVRRGGLVLGWAYACLRTLCPSCGWTQTAQRGVRAS